MCFELDRRCIYLHVTWLQAAAINFSIFFVFIREPGQNVRCHKFGELCTLDRC